MCSWQLCIRKIKLARFNFCTRATSALKGKAKNTVCIDLLGEVWKKGGSAAADERRENRNTAVTITHQDFLCSTIFFVIETCDYMDFCNTLNSTGTIAYIVNIGYNTGSN